MTAEQTAVCRDIAVLPLAIYSAHCAINEQKTKQNKKNIKVVYKSIIIAKFKWPLYFHSLCSRALWHKWCA